MRTKIFDMFVQEKWEGRLEISSSVMTLSTSYAIMNNQHNLMSSSKMFKHLRHDLFSSPANTTHAFMFEVWKKDCNLRYTIEFLFNFCLIIVFQFYISEFNILLFRARAHLHDLTHNHHLTVGSAEYNREAD